jgi:2,5-diketo-D-gluconate reductase B
MQYLQVRHYVIPQLGLGTFDLRGKEAAQVVELALNMGYRHIDTAQMYGNETEVGTAIRRSGLDRDDLWVTTKVWHTELAEERFLPSVQASLERLSLDYVDLLLIHWPSPSVSVEEATMGLMKALDREYCRAIGVSNFPLGYVKAAEEMGAEIITNQVEYHPFLDQSQMLHYLQQSQMSLTAYSPLAQGKVLQDEVLMDMGRKYGKTPAQVALRWLVEQEELLAIPRSRNPQNLRENLKVFDFRLDREDKAAIDALTQHNLRLVDPDFAPTWD